MVSLSLGYGLLRAFADTVIFLTLLEIFEFDAMDDPLSRLDVLVHNSDGPVDETTIGRTEINFVKNNLSDLDDMWLPLDGRFAQGSDPKLHLRIFLNNSRGTEVVMNYLDKMGKEVGKKVCVGHHLILSSFSAQDIYLSCI